MLKKTFRDIRFDISTRGKPSCGCIGTLAFCDQINSLCRSPIQKTHQDARLFCSFRDNGDEKLNKLLAISI